MQRDKGKTRISGDTIKQVRPDTKYLSPSPRRWHSCVCWLSPNSQVSGKALKILWGFLGNTKDPRTRSAGKKTSMIRNMAGIASDEGNFVYNRPFSGHVQHSSLEPAPSLFWEPQQLFQSVPKHQNSAEFGAKSSNKQQQTLSAPFSATCRLYQRLE